MLVLAKKGMSEMKKVLLLLLLAVVTCYFFRPTKFRFFRANYVPSETYRGNDADCRWLYLSSSFQEDSAQLYSCDELSDELISTPEQCAKCPNREMVKNACLLKCAKSLKRVATHCTEPCPANNFQESEWTTNGNCYPCNTYLSIISSEEECQKCPERSYQTVWIEHGSLYEEKRCILRACPTEEIRTIAGECVPCQSVHNVISYTTEEECLKCPNRKYIAKHLETFYADTTIAHGQCVIQ